MPEQLRRPGKQKNNATHINKNKQNSPTASGQHMGHSACGNPMPEKPRRAGNQEEETKKKEIGHRSGQHMGHSECGNPMPEKPKRARNQEEETHAQSGKPAAGGARSVISYCMTKHPCLAEAFL